MAVTLETQTRTARDIHPGSTVLAPAGSNTQVHVVLMASWVRPMPAMAGDFPQPAKDGYWSVRCLGMNGGSFEWRVEDEHEFEVIV